MTWNDIPIEILMWNIIGSYPALRSLDIVIFRKKCPNCVLI